MGRELSYRADVFLSKTRAGWAIGMISLLVILLVAGLLLIPRTASSQPELAILPPLNAGLNGASVVALVMAYIFIRRRDVKRHRFCVLLAFGLSAIFLMSYVVLHAVVGPSKFTGQDWIRPVYYTVLVSHIILASIILPLALTTLHHAWYSRFAHHRRLARWTLPIWLYVSVTGVLVYFMLYHLS
jgi:putative membrane protein